MQRGSDIYETSDKKTDVIERHERCLFFVSFVSFEICVRISTKTTKDTKDVFFHFFRGLCADIHENHERHERCLFSFLSWFVGYPREGKIDFKRIEGDTRNIRFKDSLYEERG